MILRNADRRSWLTMDRFIFDDSRVGGEEIAVLSWLLSRPDSWSLNVKTLGSRLGWGRDKTYKIVKRLVSLGYITQETRRDAQGRIVGTDYIVHETPQNSTKNPHPELPDTAEPDTDKPDTAEPDTANQEAYIDNNNSKTMSVVSNTYHSRTFDLWWDMYDKKVDRKGTFAKWRKLKSDDIGLILEHTPEYVIATPEVQYRAHPKTYLNREYFKTSIEHLVGGRSVQGSSKAYTGGVRQGIPNGKTGLGPREFLAASGFSDDEADKLLGANPSATSFRPQAFASRRDGHIQGNNEDRLLARKTD